MECVLEVLSPQARTEGALRPIKPARRLSELTGKTVGLVWNAKRGGDVALSAIALELEKLGVHSRTVPGTFPCSDAVIAEVAKSCDGVVLAIGDCGASAAWAAHDVWRLESIGIPAAALVASGYEEDAVGFAAGRGVTHQFVVTVTEVFSTIDQIRTAAGGCVPDIIARLSKPTTQSVHSAEVPRTIRYQGSDALEAAESMNVDFLSRRWGDGYPLLPPTASKVDAMLGRWETSREDVCAIVPPGSGIGTFEKIAVNAVMAGASPEHFPVLVAAVEALGLMGEPATRMAVSAAPLAPLLVVNGPIVDRLKINYGRCALGPGRESAANVAIGRAFRLVMMNLGICYPGQLDTDTIGTAKKFGMCLAENVVESPWESFHVERGFELGDSTVSLFCVGSESLGTDLWNSSSEAVLRSLANEECRPGGWYLVQAFGGEKLSEHGLLVLLSPEHAKLIAGDGWTKYQVKQFLWREASMSANRLMNKWWSLRERVRLQWRWLLDLSHEELVKLELPTVETPDHFQVVVVGGESPFDSIYGTFGAPVTVRIPEG